MFRHFAAAIAFACACAAPAAAAPASRWDESAHAAARLIAGRTAAGDMAVRRAGIEIRLAPGWKTYWRYPGDSGVPPRFDFSASTNVKDVAVRWPAPMRFKDGDGSSIGYAERLVLPLQVVAADPRAPVTLRLKLDYAICEKLCVPVEAALELALEAGEGEEAVLAAGEARVPRRVAPGAAGALSIVAVKREAGTPPRILVDVRAAEGESVDLFAEGPASDWSLPLPLPLAPSPPGVRRFAFALDGVPPGAATEGATLTLTAVTPADAIETVVHLD